jgi:hypothetical protein
MGLHRMPHVGDRIEITCWHYDADGRRPRVFQATIDRLTPKRVALITVDLPEGPLRLHERESAYPFTPEKAGTEAALYHWSWPEEQCSPAT